MERDEFTDVIICGGGPTGVMLSALLGQMSVTNVVLEREAEITHDPRGIALDEDGIRMLQRLGLYDQIYCKIGSPMGIFNFVGGVHSDLSRKPFMVMDYNTTEGGTGHVHFICHKQPAMEKSIRDVIAQSPSSQLRPSSTVNSISEDSEMVQVEYLDASGNLQRIRAKYLVGADGKTGYTRKKYLEPRGVKMEKCSQTSYEETWVAINLHVTLPTPESHPNFPLWSLGYSPEDVYDLFFPRDFRFLCNPSRPAVCGRFGLLADRLWRFEFVVQPGEDGVQMAKPESLARIVYPYLSHPGSRYGLISSVQFPTNCVDILRSRPFTFSARSCNKWALGRVILAGDAAHVFPPFGGQGITSGFRDASALAWRLAVLCRDSRRKINHGELLAAWYGERKQQLERSLAATIENGAYVTEASYIKAMLRDWYLWALQLVPSWKRWLEKGARRDGMARYEYRDGMAFVPELGGGGCFPQLYCCPLNEKPEQGARLPIKFTDDMIFARHKKGLFQLVVLLDGIGGVADAAEAVREAESLSMGFVLAQEATYIIQDPHANVAGSGSVVGEHTVARIATGEEFAAVEQLCGSRPPPKYYDMFRMRHEVGGRRFVIVRPDLFVFAAAYDGQEVRRALRRIATMFGDR